MRKTDSEFYNEIVERCSEKLFIFDKNDNVVDDYGEKIISLMSNLSFSYVVLKKNLFDTEKQFENNYGCQIRIVANRKLIYRMCITNYMNISEQRLPEIVIEYIKEDFIRIEKAADGGEKNFLTFENSQFYKYMFTVFFKLIPVGHQGLILSGFPRSLIIKQSLLNSIRLFNLYLKTGGNHPFYEIHYNPHRMRMFNADGWNVVFKNSAQILIENKKIKGIFGAAWFFDPQLKKISPVLGYIRALIKKIGGEFFYFGSSDMDKKNAFAMSRVRKFAYENGTYNPSSFIMIIPRNRLLRYYNLK